MIWAKLLYRVCARADADEKKKHKSLGANESAFSAAFISGLTLPYQIKFH